MLVKNSLRIIVAILICSNLFVGSGFGSSVACSSTDDLLSKKISYISAIAEQSGDQEYFLKNHHAEFLELPVVRLQELSEQKYFNGALRSKSADGRQVCVRENLEISIFKQYAVYGHEVNLLGHGLRLFPLALQSLQQLRALSLTANRLVTFPSTILLLKELKYLDVSFNRLVHLPLGLGKLSKLKGLSAENNLIEKLPQTIGGLISLEHLNLGHNRLKNLPDSFGGLRELKALSLACNSFFEPPEVLGRLPKIQSICLQSNGLWAVPLSCLHLDTLTHLDLSENDIMLAIADDVDEYEALKKKAPTCLISIFGNINSEGQGRELLRIWHQHKRPKAKGSAVALKK